ncbi:MULTISPECIES: S-methyl-5-thioribose-1-phosphate isomerase [unclassified Hydrogenobaculum]|uniref:S-methyl-5-thioribose-1-phosphate isomerase n=1 Tax=unclassified Hydrogenobaculum TaxID=2622382 RepID=UPI0001C5136C|nr:MULTISPECIES: S-methyl-5-thioribose-1-phosphate isomerase [unclassified Hydrogenobaculum]AEF18985.1 translation initiation factor, aIF-2BI family [Hydrogenobaculum sp. 3684]AGG14917.1 translation initiation factor, aIF-2BI family [Hydrogenobaculum sp. HO]AGH93213.1 S-methyl-5-thioribose-1-phosphate isomerase [Hydrogenobaculum sp. SN]
MLELKSFYFKDDILYILDQRKLPHEEVYFEAKNVEDVAYAIKAMLVRGAPAIGCVAAYGFYIGIKEGLDVEKVYDILSNTRPTAVNLFWALKRMKQAYFENKDLLEEAKNIEQEDIQANKRMSEFGASLIKEKSVVLTHCNTGALATAGVGTALGVIKELYKQGKIDYVLVDETRPYLQGSRLTAFELLKSNIPYKIIVDSSAPFLISRGIVKAVFVGADRIASNGDTANKIGTFMLSLACKAYNIPFYVVAPTSTIDFNAGSFKDIPIEERSKEEVLKCKDVFVGPIDSEAINYSFDITPAQNISAIITEKGIAYYPYVESLKSFKEQI